MKDGGKEGGGVAVYLRTFLAMIQGDSGGAIVYVTSTKAKKGQQSHYAYHLVGFCATKIKSKLSSVRDFT